METPHFFTHTNRFFMLYTIDTLDGMKNIKMSK